MAVHWPWLYAVDAFSRFRRFSFPMSQVSILHKSTAGRYWPVRVADGPMTARYGIIKNASWEAAPLMVLKQVFTRGGRKMSGLFMLLSLHVQLITHIKRKLHFISYISQFIFNEYVFSYIVLVTEGHIKDDLSQDTTEFSKLLTLVLLPLKAIS